MTQTNAQKIVDFHHAIESIETPQGLTPAIPNADILALRRTLLREEYEEVIEAFDDIDAATSEETRTEAMAALMHELADLLYVTYGAYFAFGVDADEVFAEVHRANMQKVTGPRRADGKIMKPANFQPANVARVIAEQKARQDA